MSRHAVFVDAGYLYAQGSVALAGSKQRRNAVELNIAATIANLKETAQRLADGSTLLRIYWYDGVRPQGLSSEQRQLADARDVKLRLGVINTFGEQKGVDSLLVTDLVELARNSAIADAVLLSGDEDIRIGVQIAQSFGLRVHLIGIEPSRASQSRALLQESDTTTEWSKGEIEDLLTLKLGYAERSGSVDVRRATTLPEAVAAFVETLEPDDLEMIALLDMSRPIPKGVDGRLLASCRAKIGRDLNTEEKRYVRDRLREAARSLALGSDRSVAACEPARRPWWLRSVRR